MVRQISLAIIAAPLAAACAGGPSVRPEQSGPVDPEHAILLVKFGLHPSGGVRPEDRRLALRNTGTGEVVELPFRETESTDDGFTAPAYANVRAGEYQVAGWRVDMHDGTLALSWALASLVVRVQPGQIACMGSVYVVTGAAQSSSVNTGMMVVNDCAAMRARTPLGATTPALRRAAPGRSGGTRRPQPRGAGVDGRQSECYGARA